MGSKKSKKRKNRRRKRFHAQVVERLIHDDSKYDEHKEFLKEVERKEIEELNRTIFISNARDLRIGYNLTMLKQFFESTYGPVENCCISFYENKRRSNNGRNSAPPPGKITFKSASSATKIFGKPLHEVRLSGKKNSMKLVEASIAHHGRHNAGYLKVFPAEKTLPKRAPIQEENQDPLSKTLIATSIGLGHWIPEDHGLFFINEDSSNHQHDKEKYEFVEEFSGFKGAKVKIDLRHRLLQIKIDLSRNINIFDGIFLKEENYGTITFRFKSVQTFFDLGYENKQSCYSILFSCKEPPKIHKVHICPYSLYETSYRLTSLENAPFDHCLGFKLCCQKSEFEKLFNSKDDFPRRLKEFGIMRTESLYEAIPFCTRRIKFGEYEKEMLEKAIMNIPDKKIGECFLIF